MAQLAARRLAERRQHLGDGARGREPGGEARLEAGAGRQRGEGVAQHRGGVDQRRQLRPDGGLASGQESIDGLIEAFGRRARWQKGLLARGESAGERRPRRPSP